MSLLDSIFVLYWNPLEIGCVFHDVLVSLYVLSRVLILCPCLSNCCLFVIITTILILLGLILIFGGALSFNYIFLFELRRFNNYNLLRFWDLELGDFDFDWLLVLLMLLVLLLFKMWMFWLILIGSLKLLLLRRMVWSKWGPISIHINFDGFSCLDQEELVTHPVIFIWDLIITDHRFSQVHWLRVLLQLIINILLSMRALRLMIVGFYKFHMFQMVGVHHNEFLCIIKIWIIWLFRVITECSFIEIHCLWDKWPFIFRILFDQLVFSNSCSEHSPLNICLRIDYWYVAFLAEYLYRLILSDLNVISFVVG